MQYQDVCNSDQNGENYIQTITPKQLHCLQFNAVEIYVISKNWRKKHSKQHYDND